MNIFGHHIVVLTDEQHALVKQALADAGHSVIHSGEAAIDALWAETKAKFPDLVAAMQKGIHDLANHDMPGGQKAVAVAVDALAIAPAVIQALPNAKAFLVHGVTELFAAGEQALVDAAKGLIGKL